MHAANDADDGEQGVADYDDALEAWPTPEFVHPDCLYPCESCGDYVVPIHGDRQAGIVDAGLTVKLCADCAETAREMARTGAFDQ